MTTPLTIAVPKGYLFEETIELFKKIDIYFDDLNDSRKLFTFDTTGRFKLLKIRPWDVPVYVEQGAADLGIVGKDVLNEQEPHVVSLKDCLFGGCKLVVAGPEKITHTAIPHGAKIVTKYPNSTKKYFAQLGKKIHVIKMYGAIELAPLTGLGDYICDLTATGATLKEHDLHIIDTVVESTAHLIANPVGFKIYYNLITDLLTSLDK